jgi:hypothetical protein
MAKFLSTEDRVYPTLGLTLSAGDVVELPEDTVVTGLIKQANIVSKKADVVAEAPVKEGSDNGASTL